MHFLGQTLLRCVVWFVISIVITGCFIIGDFSTDGQYPRRKNPHSTRRFLTLHSVGFQETLNHIANKYAIDVEKLRELNGFALQEEVYPGEILYIPKGRKRPPKNISIARRVNSFLYFGGLLVWPVKGWPKMSDVFGMRSRRFHYGIDIPIAPGNAIGAAHAGKVLYSGNTLSGYGNTVILCGSAGFCTLYAHNSKLKVSVGDEVLTGELIALSGNTGRSRGPHLHFEVRRLVKGRKTINVDPLPYFFRKRPQRLRMKYNSRLDGLFKKL